MGCPIHKSRSDPISLIGRNRKRADDIRLYAVSTRRPDGLLSMTGATEVKPGVWDLRVLSRDIRILVLSGLPLAQQNAVLAFFTFDAEKVRFALDHYQWQMEDGSTVINQLLDKYSLEGIAMPYTMEQFRKEYVKAHLGELDPGEVLAQFDPEEVLARFDPEDRLKGLDPEEVLARFDPEDRLKGLDPEEIETYLKKLKKRKRH